MYAWLQGARHGRPVLPESMMNSATSSAAAPVTTNTFLPPAGAVASSITLASQLALCRPRDRARSNGALLRNGARCDRSPVPGATMTTVNVAHVVAAVEFVAEVTVEQHDENSNFVGDENEPQVQQLELLSETTERANAVSVPQLRS